MKIDEKSNENNRGDEGKVMNMTGCENKKEGERASSS